MSRENGMLDDMSEEELAAAQELQNSDAPIEQAPAEDPAPAEAGQEDAAQQQQEAGDSKPNPAADPNRPDGFVPKEAVQEARRAERETRQKYDALMEKLAEAATQKPVPQQEAQEVPPDKDTDPIGYFEWENSQLRNELNQVKDATGQITDQQRQNQEHQQFVQSYTAAAHQFAQGTPDFPAAYQHLISDRDRYYQALGIADPVERQQMIANDERFIAQRAMQEGVNPAERLYALAQTTGYQAAAAQGSEDPNAKLQAQAQMQEANKSLSQVSGSNGVKDTKNADDFRNMSEAQIWDFIQKNPGTAEKVLAEVGL